MSLPPEIGPRMQERPPLAIKLCPIDAYMYMRARARALLSAAASADRAVLARFMSAHGAAYEELRAR
jgi:hypothetical protein